MAAAGGHVEHNNMGQVQRIHTHDDDLHEQRRQLGSKVVREPIDFEAERLKRLVEKSKDTYNP
jgi:hypothetical protein